jgi:hypothetical protein
MMSPEGLEKRRHEIVKEFVRLKRLKFHQEFNDLVATPNMRTLTASDEELAASSQRLGIGELEVHREALKSALTDLERFNELYSSSEKGGQETQRGEDSASSEEIESGYALFQPTVDLKLTVGFPQINHLEVTVLIYSRMRASVLWSYICHWIVNGREQLPSTAKKTRVLLVVRCSTGTGCGRSQNLG